MKHQLALVLLAYRVPVGDKERGTGDSMVEGRFVNVVKKDMQRGGVTKEDTGDRVRQRQTICFSGEQPKEEEEKTCLWTVGERWSTQREHTGTGRNSTQGSPSRPVASSQNTFAVR